MRRDLSEDEEKLTEEMFKKEDWHKLEIGCKERGEKGVQNGPQFLDLSSCVCQFQLVFLLCFSRFGNLIEVYLVSGKNVGYAKYADRISANDAITTLHGKILNGVRLKVMLADSPREESNKRQRTYWVLR